MSVWRRLVVVAGRAGSRSAGVACVRRLERPGSRWAIRRFYSSDASAMLVLIIVTVFAVDMMTDRLRTRLFPGEGR